MKEIALRAVRLLEEGQDFALAIMPDKQGISPKVGGVEPIGLAIKAKTPQKIAISIAAEMILCRHSI